MNDPAVKAMIAEANRRTVAVQGPMKDFVRDLKEIMENAEANGAKAMIIERTAFIWRTASRSSRRTSTASAPSGHKLIHRELEG